MQVNALRGLMENYIADVVMSSILLAMWCSHTDAYSINLPTYVSIFTVWHNGNI